MAHRYGLLAAQPGGRLGGRPPDSVKGLHTLMDTLPASAVAAALLFAGTNIDDIVVLAVLNASSRASGQPKRWHIWAGQYAGITALAVVSLAAGRGLALIPAHWLWLLGLLPLGLGLYKLAVTIRAQRSGHHASVAAARGPLARGGGGG